MASRAIQGERSIALPQALSVAAASCSANTLITRQYPTRSPYS
jgi:hypothetical protein